MAVRCLMRSIAIATVLLVADPADVHAQAFTISGSLSSEQTNFGLSEANGRPGVSLSAEWEADGGLFIGGNGYQTTDAPTPNRTQNLTAYAGFHWSGSNSLQYDLTVIYRVYPGDFAIDWDYPELRFDVALSPQLGLALSVTDDFYGMGTRSFAATSEYVHDFSQRWYSRIEGGYAYFDSSVIDSYGFVVLSTGLRGNRWSVEGGYRANNADPFRAFGERQIANRLMLSANWLFY